MGQHIITTNFRTGRIQQLGVRNLLVNISVGISFLKLIYSLEMTAQHPKSERGLKLQDLCESRILKKKEVEGPRKEVKVSMQARDCKKRLSTYMQYPVSFFYRNTLFLSSNSK